MIDHHQRGLHVPESTSAPGSYVRCDAHQASSNKLRCACKIRNYIPVTSTQYAIKDLFLGMPILS